MLKNGERKEIEKRKEREKAKMRRVIDRRKDVVACGEAGKRGRKSEGKAMASPS